MRECRTGCDGDARSRRGAPIVRLYPDSVGLYVKSGFPGTVVEDACLPRVASQDTDDAATVAEGAESYVIQYLVSLERLQAADGDLLFLWGFENNDEAREFLESMTASELWLTLDAVRNDRVFSVGDHWIGDGLTQAEAMLDDIDAALDTWENR